jgi:cytoskeletal protein CcmA (bactofilin family)
MRMVLLGYRSLPEPRTTGVPRPSPKRKEQAVVFGSKRDSKSDALSREDVVGNLYPDSLTSEVDVTPSPTEFRRSESTGNESVIDPHARFNGKYVSDRDLRIEGEAQGEIECQGTLIISPQARVRSAITAHNVIINGDYEGDVDCGGRFEIGSTGRVKGSIKTQVLVVKEGAHWEGSVVMTHEGPKPAAAQPPSQPQGAPKSQPAQPVASGAPAGQGSIFSKQDREGAPSGERTATGSGGGNGQ